MSINMVEGNLAEIERWLRARPPAQGHMHRADIFSIREEHPYDPGACPTCTYYPSERDTQSTEEHFRRWVNRPLEVLEVD